MVLVTLTCTNGQPSMDIKYREEIMQLAQQYKA